MYLNNVLFNSYLTVGVTWIDVTYLSIFLTFDFLASTIWASTNCWQNFKVI